MNHREDTYDDLLNVLDKAESGPLLDPKEFEREHVYRRIQDLTGEFDIAWEPGVMVPADEALADRLYAAGLSLALQTGVLCLDTNRQMLFTEEELNQALETAPAEETLGLGADTVTIVERRPGDSRRVAIAGGPFGVPIKEDLFFPYMRSYAQEPLIEILDNAFLQHVHGRTIRAGSPWEVVACWHEARKTLEVLEQVGRPGMAVGCAENASSAIGELGSSTYGGFRPSDWHQNSFISELKTTYGQLIRAAHYAHLNAHSHGFYNPIYGGYVGGAEGVAIAGVAGLLLMRACYGVGTLNTGPTSSRMACDTQPDLLPAQALVFQALSRNTHLLVANFERPAHGPGLKELLYEVAALTITSVSSGISLLEGVVSASGVHAGHATPLEVRFAAQVANACQGLDPRDADGIVRSLVSRYETLLDDANLGLPFWELYDLDTLQPHSSWTSVYQDVIDELDRMGIRIR